MDTHNNIYKINIYERYLDLKNSNKPDLDNQDLWKIFEYYSCLKLSEEYQKPFYEYDDISPSFKELNKMSRNDTGIDLSDLDKTIVQCKLRKTTLTWKECATFFGSQVIFDKELNKSIIRWDKLIITRNKDSILSDNLLERKDLFIDRPYDKTELIKYCDNILVNPPIYPSINNEFQLRDYQLEAIDMINQHHNVIINLPTGTGKNSVIIYSFKEKKKYLILVPRIILMEQLRDEIIKHKPKLKTKIQLIGDANNEFNDNKLITICVFNSVGIIEQYADKFDKIYIDEAHHINKPEIYWADDCDDVSDGDSSEGDNSEDGSNSNTEDDYTNEEEDNYYSEIETEEDKEDELKNIKSYTQIIKSLTKYNNNIYLSATIDKTEDFEYYSKDIRNMIELGYLCDYTIHIPIFSEDPDNKKTCEHLLKNYRNMIIYCNSQKEGHIINALMNKLQNNSSEYIDCMTPKKKRDDIIDRYKKGLVPFLVNVRILVEGFDSPITKGVVFFHLPNSHNTLVQIIGRCLRLHPNKTIANIILPFSCKEDEKQINNFMKVMAKNDSRIKKSYENKQLGGYINIDLVEETEDNDINDMVEFKYNLVYDSMGRLLNGEDVWLRRLDDLIKYFDENNKSPSSADKNKFVKSLGNWKSRQHKIYKNKTDIMKIYIVFDKWKELTNSEKYKQYFMSLEDKWFGKFNMLIKYIDENNKRPMDNSDIKETRILAQWLVGQQIKYKTKKECMKIKLIYDTWGKFIEDGKYKQYFLSNEDKWLDILDKVKSYIDTNQKRPSACDKDKCIKLLGTWITCQLRNFNSKSYIMANNVIYNMWCEFVNDIKYKNYFISNKEKWIVKFNELNMFIDAYNTLPPSHSKDVNVKVLNKWLSHQMQNFKNKKEIISEPDLYDKWTVFITNEKYNKYFLSNENIWMNTLNKVKKYITENNKRPSCSDNVQEINSLGNWIVSQNRLYESKKQCMTNPIIYGIWTEILNNTNFNKYILTNKQMWKYNLIKLQNYMNENNKKPSDRDIDSNIRYLGQWISHQKDNYKNKTQIMKTNPEIYAQWTEFINDPQYKKYFE